MPNQESNISALLKEVQDLRTRVAELEHQPRRASRRSPRRLWVVLSAAAALGVAGVALASPVCSNGIPFCFQANTPAQATEINTNFAQLKTWLETKVGTVSTGGVGAGTITSGAINTGAVGATSLTSSGAVNGATLTVTGDSSLGASGKTMSVFGTVQAFGPAQTLSVGGISTAGTDGFVSVALSSIGTCNSGSGQAVAYVNGSVRAQGSVHGGCPGTDYPTPYESFLVVLRKGDNMQIITSGSAITVNAVFTPFGR